MERLWLGLAVRHCNIALAILSLRPVRLAEHVSGFTRKLIVRPKVRRPKFCRGPRRPPLTAQGADTGRSSCPASKQLHPAHSMCSAPVPASAKYHRGPAGLPCLVKALKPERGRTMVAPALVSAPYPPLFRVLSLAGCADDQVQRPVGRQSVPSLGVAVPGNRRPAVRPAGMRPAHQGDLQRAAAGAHQSTRHWPPLFGSCRAQQAAALERQQRALGAEPGRPSRCWVLVEVRGEQRGSSPGLQRGTLTR